MNRMQLFARLALSALVPLLLAACAGRETRPPLATVPQVDLTRYLGTWYEIASYPAFFQRGCTGSTAEYTPLANGRIAVTNRCWKEGRLETARGVASVVPNSGNARLKVRIGPVPFAGDYYVIGLDQKNYRWAVVGHPSRNYLWILSREPRMDDAIYARIVADVARLGYDPARIARTDQTRNLAR
jgi:apolipoprotein D and lipocalin family protein